MAEGENRPRQTGRRPPQKAPVTIDLPAERVDPPSVPAAAPPPPPQPPNAPRPAAAPPPRDAPAADRLRPAAPPPRPRRGMLLLGVFLGALLGGGIVFGAGWFTLRDRLGATDDGTVAAALAEAQRVGTELETVRAALAAVPTTDLSPLAARLTALEAATADLPAIRTGIADATRTAANAETAANAQTATIDRLGADLSALEQRMLTAAVAGGDPAAIATLNQDLAAFEQRIGALERAGPPPQIATLQRRVDDLARQIAGFATTATALQGDTAERDRTEAAARALALSGLQAAIARGEPFAAQLAVLGQLGVAPAALDALEAYATEPPPTAAQLAASFPAIADAVLAATNVTDPDANFLERLIGNARTVVTVRPTAPIEGTTPAAILSRMQAAADAGNFPAALGERDALPDAGQAASAEWAAGASARIALDAALATLVAAMGTTATP